jgi:hypothetical protein
MKIATMKRSNRIRKPPSPVEIFTSLASVEEILRRTMATTSNTMATSQV